MDNSEVKPLSINWTAQLALGIQAMGPGVLMAAAAIGASHLVSSTRAGAEFGWQLAWVILGVNLLKYPFFAAGARYTAATGESLLHGYLKQGRGYLWLFTGLNVIASIASTAGVCMLTAAMLTQFIPLPIDVLALLVLISSLLLLILGHYSLLDRLTKIIMFALTLTTLIAVTLALDHVKPLASQFISPSPWQWAHVGFLVAMMGWMPAPIEVSAWNSLWLLEKQKTSLVTPSQALLDFNLGYIVTALLAVVFLALGALVMHGSGEHFSESGAQFANQLINLYSQVMGGESRYLIGIVAFLCIFSTTVTVIDGYSRTLNMGWQLLARATVTEVQSDKRLTGIMLSVSALGLLLILFFKGALLPLLEFVMILAFMTTVVFAWLNYRLMTSSQLPEADRYGTKMKCLSWIGLSYLLIFAVLFIYWYWVKA
ncbi:divalent metal cation transporter [Shewanella sp. LC6]|jgi:Mn2+/Fe2+ NRAMP family transporter|uniref:Nramp family divalent metal transporter n=1 Tax=unclassified Shewanella TaxID=196818 RepID=UPI001128EB17|nr:MULTISPECIES: Nramp family divalent metal transporter [unclassified Shewanella]QQK58824.1 divalent metal cation transporter [Shewanella sp. LC6]TPE50609.1 divalent metal cation transporter [Shewanella sp. LC2]